MSKNILMVWGGWEGHTPQAATELHANALREAGHTVDVYDNLDIYLDEDRMAAADVIVQSVTMADITGKQAAALMKAVREGKGFAGWHGGVIDSFRSNTDYQWMTGAQWVSHPGGCIPSYTVEITDPDHETTRGLSGFALPDTEQYYCHVDPGNTVLATSTFTGEHGETDCYPAGTVMPYAWTRQWGKGRVFIVAWGHTDADFKVPEAMEIMQRGIVWAAG